MKRVLYSIILFSSIGIPTAFSSPSKDHNTDSSDFDPETSTVDDNGPLNFVAENTEKPSTPTYARKQLLLTKKFNPSVLERFRGKGSSDVPKQSTVGKLANSTINLFDGNKKEEGPYSTNLKKIRSLVCKILLQKRQGIGPNEISLNRRLSEGIQSRIQGKQSIEALAKEVVQWLEAQPFSSLSPELKNSLNEIKKFLQSLTQVDVEKYIAANPVSRLGDIPEDAKIQTLKLLGQGGMGEIHAARITNNNKVQDVVVKKAKEKFQKDLEKEIAVGNELKEKYHSISSDTLLSEIQGLRGIVLPQKLQNMAIQEKINGKNGLEAICSDRPLKFYKNGFVANPQKALQFICQLLAELYALHANGKVHCDLKLENIMIEGPLKNSIDEDEYIIRIIDLGLAANIGDDAELGTGSLNGAPEIMSPPNCEEPDKNKVKVSPAADIYAFGTMLPTLLFGKGAGSVRESSLLSFTAERSKNDGSILPSEFVKMYKAWEIEAYEAIGKELVKNKYGVTTDQPLGLLRKQKKGNGGGIADGDDGYEYAIAEDDIVNHNIAVKINEKTSTIESILDTCS
ncbi:MAG: protein kinase, partial [Puniceicoccales bacterium]|nr:protein kinase [Puniceicoccales bacterium]